MIFVDAGGHLEELVSMTNSQPRQLSTGIIARTLRLMLGALLCWMAYTVMSAETTSFNLYVLWVFGGVLIFYLLTHLAIRRFRPDRLRVHSKSGHAVQLPFANRVSADLKFRVLPALQTRWRRTMPLHVVN